MAQTALSPETHVQPHEQLTSLLNRSPDFAKEARVVIARTALDYLDAQIAHFSQVTAQRDLTDAERRFGREELIPLSEMLRSLFGSRTREG